MRAVGSLDQRADANAEESVRLGGRYSDAGQPLYALGWHAGSDDGKDGCGLHSRDEYGRRCGMCRRPKRMVKRHGAYS